MLTVANDQDKGITFTADDMNEVLNWLMALQTVSKDGKQITMEDFTIVSVIGRGFYGKVMLCKSNTTGECFAIKTVHKARLVQSNKVDTILRERDILAKCRHPFVVSLRFAFQTATKFYLGIEYVPGGELFRLMSEEEELDMDQVRLYLAELFLAVDYLHSIGVIYRDIKPENILLSADGHIKLTDFGLSKEIGVNESTKTFCGTPEYVAPEVILREPYSFPVDWWSLGILTYEMLFGEIPFESENSKVLFDMIINHEPEFPEETEEEVKDFILQLLHKDSQKRGSLETLKNHPFWNGLNFNDVLNKKIKPKYIPDCGDWKVPNNFDSEFTQECPMDSAATPPGSPHHFSNFSFDNLPTIPDASILKPIEMDGIGDAPIAGGNIVDDPPAPSPMIA